jgi:hypothetical protein
MVGSSKEIAETIKKSHYAQMTSEEKAQFEQFQNAAFLYMQPFDSERSIEGGMGIQRQSGSERQGLHLGLQHQLGDSSIQRDSDD